MNYSFIWEWPTTVIQLNSGLAIINIAGYVFWLLSIIGAIVIFANFFIFFRSFLEKNE
jgi:hypothetical protein